MLRIGSGAHVSPNGPGDEVASPEPVATGQPSIWESLIQDTIPFSISTQVIKRWFYHLVASDFVGYHHVSPIIFLWYLLKCRFFEPCIGPKWMEIPETEVQKPLFQMIIQKFLNSLNFENYSSFPFIPIMWDVYKPTINLTSFGQIPTVCQILRFSHSFSIVANSVKQRIHPQNGDSG